MCSSSSGGAGTSRACRRPSARPARLPADQAWERYADLDRWSHWAPRISGVTVTEPAGADTRRLRTGLRGRVRAAGVIGLPFEVTAVDEAARTWSWRVSAGPITLHLDHGVEEARADDGPRVRSRTWLRTTGPAVVVLPYAPLRARRAALAAAGPVTHNPATSSPATPTCPSAGPPAGCCPTSCGRPSTPRRRGVHAGDWMDPALLDELEDVLCRRGAPPGCRRRGRQPCPRTFGRAPRSARRPCESERTCTSRTRGRPVAGPDGPQVGRPRPPRDARRRCGEARRRTRDRQAEASRSGARGTDRTR